MVRALLKHPDIRVNQRLESDGEEGRSALQYCLSSQDADEDARLATLEELLKHPGLDRGDMNVALQRARADKRLSRHADVMAVALGMIP